MEGGDLWSQPMISGSVPEPMQWFPWYNCVIKGALPEGQRSKVTIIDFRQCPFAHRDVLRFSESFWWHYVPQMIQYSKSSNIFVKLLFHYLCSLCVFIICEHSLHRLLNLSPSLLWRDSTSLRCHLLMPNHVTDLLIISFKMFFQLLLFVVLIF